jgi:hypothetical protein
MKTIALCLLLAGVCGAQVPELEVYTKPSTRYPGAITISVREKCYDYKDKNAPADYCLVAAEDKRDERSVTWKSMWCPCPETEDQKIERLEKRIENLEKRMDGSKSPAITLPAPPPIDPGMNPFFKDNFVPCGNINTQVGGSK